MEPNTVALQFDGIVVQEDSSQAIIEFTGPGRVMDGSGDPVPALRGGPPFYARVHLSPLSPAAAKQLKQGVRYIVEIKKAK